MKQTNDWPTTRDTLIFRIRDSQDTLAWRRFVDLYLPLIYRYSRRRGLQDADAQNVVQDVLAVVSRAIRSFEYDPTRGRFRNWLGLITHQRILRHIDGESHAPRGLGDGAGDDLCNDVAFEVDGEWIEVFNAHVYQYVCDLVRPEFDRETWDAFQRVWEGDTRPKDLAALIGRTPDWVYQAKFKVLQRVKQEVVHLCDDEVLLNRPR